MDQKRKHESESEFYNEGCEHPLKIAKAEGSVEDPVTVGKGLLRLKGYFSARKGERDEMQDAHVILAEYHSLFSTLCNDITRLGYFAVFDGHGGHRASRHAADNFHKILIEKFPKGETLAAIEKDLKRCFVETFKSVDDEFLSLATKAKPVWKDGSTATTLLVINDVLYAANLGDSRAMLCRYKTEDNKDIGIILTKDHNPTMFEERMRIQKAGGNVKDGRIMGILEVSRSLGDGQYKNHGVSCVPEIKRCALTPNDRYLLIACDGLWKAFTAEEAMSTINLVLQDSSIQLKEEDIQNQITRADCLWQAACNRLAADAVRKGSGDNVTVVIVALGENINSPTAL